MDRTTYTVCARLPLLLGVVLAAGCGPSVESLSPLPSASQPALQELSSRVLRDHGRDLSTVAAGLLPDGSGDLDAQADPSLDDEDLNEQSKSARLRIVAPQAEDGDADEANPALDRWRDVINDVLTPLEAPESAAPVEARTVLPWAVSQRQAPAIVAAIKRADARVRHGFSLADRGALFSARAEFLAALESVAEANDLQQSTLLYSKALAAALRSLEELRDFLPQGQRPADPNLPRIVAGHKTPVLKGLSLDGWAPSTAAERYVVYAQEQLAAVACGETTGSMALYGLGRVTVVSTGGQRARSYEEAAPALAFYYAALMAHPDNFLAANELAVLLAERGELPRARDLLLQSASRSSRPVTWRNLSVVHARLGEWKLAEAARQQAEALEHAAETKTTQSVEWLDADTFARTMPPSENRVPPKAAAAPARAAEAPKKNTNGWNPWNSRR